MNPISSKDKDGADTGKREKEIDLSTRTTHILTGEASRTQKESRQNEFIE